MTKEKVCKYFDTKMSTSIPPKLPGTSPPELPSKSDEKWLLEEDIEVTQLIPEHENHREIDEIPQETASRLRLEADLNIEKDEKNCENKNENLLQPARIPKRRRSPITVQEWVASLPVHHLIQREQ